VVTIFACYSQAMKIKEATGLAVGIALGVAIGAMFDNIAMG
jgi:hypothetical protein